MGKGRRRVSETMSSFEETANKSSSVTSNDHVDSQSIEKSDSASSTSIGEVLKKGPWTSAEDEKLKDYVRRFGEGNWNNVKKFTGLNRCGKSCRLRWSNHLRPGLKKGSFSPKEEEFVIKYHYKHGSKWAHMAGHLRGRTDNEIKNFWNTRVKRLERDGKPIYPPELMKQADKEKEKENGWDQRNIELAISDTLHVGRFETGRGRRGSAQQLYEHDDIAEENISPPQTTSQIPHKRSSTPQGCDDSVSSTNHSEKRPCIGTSGPHLEQDRRVCSYMNYSSLCLALPSIPDRSYLPSFGSIISGNIAPLGGHLYSPQPLSEASNEELPSLQNSVFETGPADTNPPTWCPNSLASPFSTEDRNNLQPSTSAPKFSGLIQDVVTESQLKHSKSSTQSDRISPDDQAYVIPETCSLPASTLYHVSNYHDSAILSTADGIHGNSKPPSTSAIQSTGLLNDVIMKPQLIYSESFARTDVISETNGLPSSSSHHVSNSQNNAIPSVPAVDVKLEARSAISVPEQIFKGKQPYQPESTKTESLLAGSTFEDPDGIDLIPMYFGDDYLGVEESLLADMQYLGDWPAL